jgi:hypothetical protein
VRSRRSRQTKVIAGILGAALTATATYAATNWVVGLAAGSSGEGQSATIANLTITAVSAPSAANLLYPGGNGDVVVSISNSNTYPVTITAVQLPTNTTFATGYTANNLVTPQAGCLASTPSDVIWNYSTGSSRLVAYLDHTAHGGGERPGQQPARSDSDQ